MFWKRMSVNEFAVYSKANGMYLEKIDDTWWVEVRPCFFRPLFPFTLVDPRASHYPAKSAIGGFLHAVPPGVPANAELKMFVYDDIQNYSIDTLKSKQRYITRKGINNFEVRQIENLTEFVEEAYEIYLYFYYRTKYGYKKERVVRNGFDRWSEILFTHPGIVVLGAYHQDTLSAIDISYRVDDVIMDDIFFSDGYSQNLKVTDCMLHTLREAAASSDAKYLFRGLPTGKRSLDESKLMRGCKTLILPARCRINSLALFGAKYLMRDSYKKLVALTSLPVT